MMIGTRSQFSKAYKLFGSLTAVVSLLATVPARADVTFEPFVDLRQVVSDGTGNGDEARGWLSAGAGFDLGLETRRVNGNINYHYSRRIEEFGDVDNRNQHDASGAVRAEVVDEFLFLDAGGTASMYTNDYRGYSSVNEDSGNDNETQIVSGFVQPSIHQKLGDFANLDAHYRLGAVSASGDQDSIYNNPGDIGLDPADGIGAQFSDSVSHSGGVTVASAQSANRISWSLNGTGTAEDIDQLNQEYRGYSAGGELGYKVSRKFELLGSVGYEDIENTQDNILFDPITGEPVVDEDGDFVINPLIPRRTAYDFSGVYWNVGFRYAPSRRTMLEVRGGERYGQSNFLVDFSFQARSGTLVTANFSQEMTSFGRMLTQYYNGVPYNQQNVGGSDELGVPYCTIGIDPSGNGACLGGLTQSVTPATYIADRGIVNVSREVDSLTISAAAFYEKRRYVDAQQLQAPGVPELTSVGDDEAYGVRGRVSVRIDDKQSIAFDALVAHNSYALSRDRKDVTATIGTSYSLRLNDQLSANASLYGSQRWIENRSNDGYVTASVGLRYRF